MPLERGVDYLPKSRSGVIRLACLSLAGLQPDPQDLTFELSRLYNELFALFGSCQK
jgi:hypothetical protein